jgi:hypothetical protein
VSVRNYTTKMDLTVPSRIGVEGAQIDVTSALVNSIINARLAEIGIQVDAIQTQSSGFDPAATIEVAPKPTESPDGVDGRDWSDEPVPPSQAEQAHIDAVAARDPFARPDDNRPGWVG